MMSLRGFFSRRAVPEWAHGQRNIDGSYFAVWLCERGHGQIAGEGLPGVPGCTACLYENFSSSRIPAQGTASANWRHASQSEAENFIYELDGALAFNNVGYRLVNRTEREAAKP